MSLIKDKYRQFRQWQQQPFEYHDSHDHHGCCNCGAESENNYCPRCGQKAVYGPITWHSVWQGILDVWGVGTRSLPYTLWQLVWRPGYLMRDYISGKRQVSFPPVKMLVVVGVVILLLGNWLDPGAVIEEDPVAPTGLRHYIDVAFNWLNRNMEWWVLLLFSLMIVPIWSLFREAPKYPHHTLPQGFYIQVFASTQFLLWMMLIAAFGELFLDTASNYAGLIVFIFLVPLMLLIDFKQLFGYGWWGTLWRAILAVPMGILFMQALVQFGRVIIRLIEQGMGRQIWMLLLSAADGVVVLWLLMELVGVVNRKEWREHGWWHVFKRPVIAALALLLTSGMCYIAGQDSSIINLYQAYEKLVKL
jgi:hypothetical protein